jgi:hypothetical protein
VYDYIKARSEVGPIGLSHGVPIGLLDVKTIQFTGMSIFIIIIKLRLEARPIGLGHVVPIGLLDV